ncbi:hypothetical protein KB879_32425 (plasmid) [Cupriavidus sp. KK10]|uniref:hypothetical protein n=1 Tax=Cupriavidus sp. KK10 TaxID=1478019 RepID=UPI001BA7DE26|nr:hypothetical protein [Cupriavidus sp. KK10]QUN26666.1 hypothetical protein KB879_21415 [Cupriavidus sp. KK10]QUN32400.1 hypothetical protein KB879_32425 [Cupriavidus sp. KK10]
MEEGIDDNSFYSRRMIDGRTVDTSHWASPDEGALTGDRRVLYLARKQAVSLYLSGASADSIRRLTSLGTRQVYRLIRERCLETHPDGRPYGWRGLVPWLRVKPYRRSRKVHVDQFGRGAAGAMQALLDCQPALRQAFEARILASASAKRLVETKQSRRRHCAWFLDQLRSFGYEARNEWPFNTSSLGYYSICRYIDKVLSANPRALAAASGGPNLALKLRSGDGTGRPVLRFMQRVEMDAHKLDGRFCVSLPLMGGGFKEKIVHRLWVVVILEVISRAVLGYYFSVRREISNDDVMRALKRALGRWCLRPVSFCDTPYLPEAGLLSALGNDFVGLCWDETSVDGALAETCQHVRDALRDSVGSTLLDPKTSFSKRRSKDDRPFIEAFFRNLAGQGFQRLSNTTGANFQDRKGRQPEEVALASRFQYEYAEELLDVLIANYNATPHSGIGNRTPLAYAKFLYHHSQQSFRRADPAVVDTLFSIRKRCIVRGGAASGRAPFVEFHYGRYTNDVLHNRHDLVGSEIWVVCHKEDDCRVALASTLDGMSLGVLRAAPPWNMSPHSLSLRAAICQACSHGKFAIPAGVDAIDVFMRYVESQAHNRLPVHPAYLEARRILTAAADSSIGPSMLDAAMARAKAGSSFSNHSKGSAQEPTARRAQSGAADPPKPPAGSTLPPRRMAQSR